MTQAFQAALTAKTAVKIIAGIANFDVEHVLSVARAAEAAGAQALDVAARADIVRAARETFTGTLFASSVKPEELAEAVSAGANVAELGNFDALYAKGLFLNAEDVLALAAETVNLVQGKALVSITVPGHLSIDSQTRLAVELEKLGVDLIQTEGSARVLAEEPTVKSLTQEEKEALTLRNTKAIAAAVKLPVMTASGITADNVATAFEAGAAAVGVGSFVNQLRDEAEMTTRVQAVLANTRKVLSQVS